MDKVTLTPILSVEDVDRSIAYYRDKLGFKNGFRWSNPEKRMLGPEEKGPAHFANIHLDGVEIYLAEKAQGQPGMWMSLTFARMVDLNNYYRRIEGAGAVIESALEKKPWGLYEAVVADLDGHRLRVGGPSQEEAPWKI
jgi:uncharacterized glyoxalase superfamily protein PhnB